MTIAIYVVLYFLIGFILGILDIHYLVVCKDKKNNDRIFMILAWPIPLMFVVLMFIVKLMEIIEKLIWREK